MARLDKIYKNIDTLEAEYAKAIEDIAVSQISFSSGEGNSSSTFRSPEKIRKEIDALHHHAEVLEARIRSGRGMRYLGLRRNPF